MTATTHRTADQGQTVSEVPGQPGRVITGGPAPWSSNSGLPDPITRPADPFAGIPGAYDDEGF